jgi:hypothetical protein
MRAPAAIGLALWAAGAPVFAAPRIVIDGSFDDWADVPIALADPRVAAGPLDITEIRLTADADALYILLTARRPLNPNELPSGTLRLALDVDGASTGRLVDGLSGTDLVIEMSPRDVPAPGHGARVVDAATGEGFSPYAIGYMYGPSYASERLEIRLDRGAQLGSAPPAFGGPRAYGRFTYQGAAGEGDGDRTAIFTAELPPRAAAAPHAEPGQLARAPGTDFRVLGWNVSHESLVRHPDVFARILAAIRPDVVVFDEVSPACTVADIRRILPPGPPSEVFIGSSGGDQRALVAAPRAAGLRALAFVEYPEAQIRPLGRTGEEEPEALIAHGVATGGARIEVGGRALLAVSLDLTCCEGAESPPDRLRQIETRQIREAIRKAQTETPAEGLVILGDFNLVGSRRPLDILAARLDAGADLEVARPLQLDGRSAATWRRAGDPFAPAHTDFLLYSGSTLEVLRSFVFDSEDLSPEDSQGVLAPDSAVASDHLPVVADFRFRRRR